VIVGHRGRPRAVLPHQIRHRRAGYRCRLPELNTPVTAQAPLDETLCCGINITDFIVTEKGFQRKHYLRALVRGRTELGPREEGVKNTEISMAKLVGSR